MRHLERVPLGTPYTHVVRRIVEVTQMREIAGRCTVVVDATGVGAPVVDLLKEARLDAELVPVMITAGEHPAKSQGWWNVPKRDLVTRVQVMLEERELEIAAALTERRKLVEELMGMRRGFGRSGRAVFGAVGKGHDDLVLAVALACWRASAGTVGEKAGRLL